MTTLTSPETEIDLDHYGPQGRSAWLDINWAEHQKWLEIDGRHTNVIDVGSGPPLLLVHGLSACWQVWLENIPHLAENHRVIALDLPGSGRSEMPKQAISIESYVGFLANVLDQLEIPKTSLVGNSMGGLICSLFAATYPSRVEKLILVDPAGLSTFGLDNPVLLTFGKTLHKLAELSTRNPQNIVRRKRMRHVALRVIVRYPDKLGPEHCYELIASAGKPSVLPALKAILNFELLPHLEKIEAPTLIIWGGSDLQISVKDAYKFARAIPNAELKIYEDTGHAPMLERPNRFNRDASEFFAEVEA